MLMFSQTHRVFHQPNRQDENLAEPVTFWIPVDHRLRLVAHPRYSLHH